LVEPESSACAGSGELTCDDDSGADKTSVIEYELAADAEVIIVIDGYDRDDEGLYTLHINACSDTDGGDDDGGDDDGGDDDGGGGGWGGGGGGGGWGG
jgi:hypothetical protein